MTNPRSDHGPSAIRHRQFPRPLVYLVGAGPGDPGLLTLRAVECLGLADLVIYDKLVPLSFLEHAPTADKICVSELAEAHRDRYIPVQEKMVEAAAAGRTVVRLKGGDPFIFGRGGEEAEYLEAHGVPFEIVPGVTAAVGVTAYTGIPVTHRAIASCVALVTGHENPDKPESVIDWPSLAKFPGTIVVYMGLSRVPHIAQTLIGHGADPGTPAAVIYKGTMGEQQTVEAPLGELPERVQQAGFMSPALVVIGPVVAMRRQLAWFEKRPLFGQRILVTRPRHQAARMAHKIELLGGVPFVLPVLDICEIPDWGPVDGAVAELSGFDWVVFTSANGVEAFFGRLLSLGRDVRALGGVRVAAIGPSTAEALARYHVRADLVPASYRSEELAAALRPLVTGRRVLLARANRGRDVLPAELSRVADVTQVAVYEQCDGVDAESPEMDNLRRGEIRYVTLTSPNGAAAFARSLDETCRRRIESGETGLVTISPVTSEKVREMGLPVAAEATEYTTDGIIDALIRLVQNRPEVASAGP